MGQDLEVKKGQSLIRKGGHAYLVSFTVAYSVSPKRHKEIREGVIDWLE